MDQNSSDDCSRSGFVDFNGRRFFNSWHNDHNFSVSKQPNLIVQNHTVTVPEGETVKGDVTVKTASCSLKEKSTAM